MRNTTGPGLGEGDTASGGLVVRGLCKRYGAIVVADQVALSVARGQCLGVIGPNGAGKSSLFNLITGVARADASDQMK